MSMVLPAFCPRPQDRLLAPCDPGDFTWNSMSGRSVRLKPVSIQSLSELERARLQEVAYNRLHQDYDLGCQITIPKGRTSLTLKFNSLHTVQAVKVLIYKEL
ncbi:rho GTPase-activating protein 6 isoform X1, partial [Tachysurus ichikawai]